MKLKIRIKRFDDRIDFPKVIDKGDWVDLRSRITVQLKAPQADVLKKEIKDGHICRHRDVKFQSALIPLGVAMELPNGFEAVLTGRSCLTTKFGVIKACSGIIDNSYCGEQDEWKFNVIAIRDALIQSNDRICQFRIQPSQKATFWQKLKWLLCSGIKLEEVSIMSNDNRNGFGSTGTR
jgi:dUTP pyrophosphatase